MSKVHYVASKPWHGSSRLQWGWLHSLQSKQTWRRQHGLRWNRNWAAVKFQNLLCGRIWGFRQIKKKATRQLTGKLCGLWREPCLGGEMLHTSHKHSEKHVVSGINIQLSRFLVCFLSKGFIWRLTRLVESSINPLLQCNSHQEN